MTTRPYGQQSDFQKQLEADSARAAQDSPMERWTDAEVQRNRRGESEYLYPPTGCAGQAPQDADAGSGAGSGGPLAGFLRALDG